MKKIYLDSVELDKSLIKSVLVILYNTLVFNRIEVNEYKLSFDK